jgi:hypothetical protein
MLPHLPGDMSYDLMAVLEFYTKLSARKGLYDRARKLNDFFTPGHKYIFPIYPAIPGIDRFAYLYPRCKYNSG